MTAIEMMSGIEIGDRDERRAMLPESRSGIETDADIEDSELLSTDPQTVVLRYPFYRAITKSLSVLAL